MSFALTTNYSGSCDNGTSVANGGFEADGTTYKSAASSALGAGSYAYSVSISDPNYLNYTIDNAASECEPFTVDKGDLTIRTDIHDSSHNVVTGVPSGSVVHDTAKLGGAVSGFNPDLTKVSFAFFTNDTCTAPGTAVGNGTPESTYVARSVDSGALANGSFSYSATFAGDDNYNAAGPATCEPLSVLTNGFTMGFWGNKNGQKLLGGVPMPSPTP